MNCAKLGMMACAERKLIKNKMGPSRSPDLCYNTFLPDTGQGGLDNYAKETWYGLLNAPATEPGQHHLSGWLPYGAGDRTARPGASAPSPTNPGYVTRNVILSHQRGGSHARVMSYDSCVMKLMVGYSVSFFSIFSFGQFESKRVGHLTTQY